MTTDTKTRSRAQRAEKISADAFPVDPTRDPTAPRWEETDAPEILDADRELPSEEEFEEAEASASDERDLLEDMTALTARLAEVLAEEVDMLREMRVREIEPLQKKKVALLAALEKLRREFDRRPEVFVQATQEQVERFTGVVQLFNSVLKENRDMLLLAREVNAQVVQAIGEVVADASSMPTYDKRGMPEDDPRGAPPITLNEQI